MTAPPAIHDLREAVAQHDTEWTARATRDLLNSVLDWVRSVCPCGNEGPAQCPVCGARIDDPNGVCTMGSRRGFPEYLLDRIEQALGGISDAILAGPIASEHARLTERAEKAEAQVEALKEWAGEPEGWPALSDKWNALVLAAEGDHSRALAAEAENATLKAAAARDAEVIARMRAGLKRLATLEPVSRYGTDCHELIVRCSFARAILTSPENADV